jgi:hypothetical protein
MEEPVGTAPATAGGLRRLRARPWLAVPAVLVLLAAAFAAMDAADDDRRRSGDPEAVAGDLFPTDDSPATTALDGEPVGTAGGGSSSGRAAATQISTGRPTSTPGPTPTTQPGSATPGPTSTTQPGSSPSPSPSETDPPHLTGLRAGGELPDGDDRIVEDAGCGGPTTISVEARAFDSSGIRSMTLYWSFAGASGPVTGSRTMTDSGGLAQATFGPFPAGTAPAEGVQITWFVEATDRAGNTTRAHAPASPSDERITLARCG